MGNSSSFRIENSILFVKLSGVLNKEVILSTLRGSIELEGYQKDMNRIWDFRNVTEINIERSDLYEVVHTVKANSRKMANYRIAYVAERNLMFGLTRMFSAMADRLPITTMSFRDYNEALAWVSEPKIVSNIYPSNIL